MSDDQLNFAKTRGRPTKGSIGKLKTKIWFTNLCSLSGYQNPYQVWKNIDNKKGSLSTWIRYKEGEREADNYGEKSRVVTAAKVIPGSDVVFRSHIWRILQSDSVSTTEVMKEAENLNEVIQAALQGRLWSRESLNSETVSTYEMLSVLAGSPDFETLQAAILLLAVADNASNHGLWNAACELYRLILPELILDETIPHRFELFGVIDNVARKREYVNARDWKNNYEGWEDQLPKCKEILLTTYYHGLGMRGGFFPLDKELFSEEQRLEMANEIVEFVWQDVGLRYASRDLWRPLGWLEAKFFYGHLKRSDYAEEQIRELRLKEMDEFRSDAPSSDDFCIIFRGDA